MGFKVAFKGLNKTFWSLKFESLLARLILHLQGQCPLVTDDKLDFCTQRKLQHSNIQNFNYIYPYKDEAQTALFKDPVRTAL